MSDQRDFTEFPELSNKLSAPTKKSLFERQKAEAEAKRIREEAETAAVYEDFVKSFEEDGKGSFKRLDTPGKQQLGNNAFEGSRLGSSGPPKRHFAPGGGKNLNSGPGSLGPLPSVSRKRALDGSRISEKGPERGLFAFEDSPERATDAATLFRASDDENDVAIDGKDEERAAPRPTLHLSSLPTGTSPAVVRSMIPSTITVDNVRILPSSDQSSPDSTERRSIAAIVTLAKETPASDIDTAVNSLQNKYLGWGFYLSISRHLSSAALGSLNQPGLPLTSFAALPFGAKPLSAGDRGVHSHGLPMSLHRGGFAPPSSYSSRDTSRSAPRAHVKISPPSDIKQLKLIHKTLELLLTHGPEFEALLMSRAEVQREEKWAWLWDSRSSGGIWYRWRLWQILTGDGLSNNSRSRGSSRRYQLFEGGFPWTEPEDSLSFEFTTTFDDFISDSDYDSSEEDDSGDEAPSRRRRQFDHQDRHSRVDSIVDDAANSQSYLNPLHRAKLIHLLSRLPQTSGKLRKGDVARVTAFAITHAGRGADEVVDILISNITQPLNRTRTANSESRKEDTDDVMMEDIDILEPKNVDEATDRKEDFSGSVLIALHTISDVLSASSTSGVRHAWRYRSLFENALKARKIFPWLGRLEKTLGWGRLRAEKWRRSINGVFQLWEGWCVFPSGTHEEFVNDFNHPPLTKEEILAEEARKMQSSVAKDGVKSKWKSVESKGAENSADDTLTSAENVYVVPESIVHASLDGDPMMDEDLDGEPMDDIDGEPMDEGDLDRESGTDGDVGDIEKAVADSSDGKNNEDEATVEKHALREVPRRPRAEDMFADSDED